MNKVYIKRCNNYAVLEVESLLRAAMSELELNIYEKVSRKKVLLKPNLLGAHAPEKAVTTHPILVESVIKLLKDCDCEISLGDSPNGVQKSLQDVWSKTGMDELCNRYGIKKRYFEKEGASLIDGILVSNPIRDADYIINLPKLKTHGLTLLTCAVKNMFGVVPGLRKAAYHRQAKDKKEFAEFLVRIAEVKRPDLNIVDGIVAMAGNGPSGGYPIKTNIIAVSEEMHLIDLLFAKMLNIPPAHIDTIDAAIRLEVFDIDSEYKVLGDDISDFDFSEYKLPVTYTTKVRESKLFNFFVKRLMNSTKVKPRVDTSKCKQCGMCKEICPMSGIGFIDGFPKIDLDKCIECYCCHEACPENAIELRESTVLKILKKFSSS